MEPSYLTGLMQFVPQGERERLESLIQKEGNLTLEERLDLSQFAKNLLSQAATIDDPSFSQLIGRVKEGLQTLKISEGELLKAHNDDSFWETIETQGVKRLVITTEEGPITYEEPVLRALKLIKPGIEEFAQKVTLTFEGEEPLIETKAKLRLCGDLFDNLFAGATGEIPLRCPRESVFTALKAVDAAEYFRADFPFKNYLIFPPEAMLFNHPNIFGQDHWEKFWGKIDPVPLPPQELLSFLNEPCPITKDGRKVIETSKVIWIPKTVDGKPPTPDLIQEIAQSDKFGANKVGYEWYFVKDAIGNKPIEGGCWVVVGPPLEETRGLSYDKQLVIMQNKCPNYGVLSAGHAIISCLAPYAASGEILLGRGQPYWTLTRCEESVDGWQVVVGALARSGLYVSSSGGDAGVLLVPARKFSGT